MNSEIRVQVASDQHEKLSIFSSERDNGGVDQEIPSFVTIVVNSVMCDFCVPSFAYVAG